MISTYSLILFAFKIDNLMIFLYFLVLIRLAGISSHYYGRVEIYYNGEWGTVCDDGWDNADATVVCRQLGFYSVVRAYRSAQYGSGTGPIWLSRLSCFGNESSLFKCGQSNVTTKNCTHSDDAAVFCDYYNYLGRIRCKYFNWIPLCLDMCAFKYHRSAH